MIGIGRFLPNGLFRAHTAFAQRQQSPRGIKLELGFGEPSRHVGQKQVSSVMFLLCVRACSLFIHLKKTVVCVYLNLGIRFSKNYPLVS